MKKPNIIFILTDDQRFDTIGALNCPHIDTPNMDRLVRSGLTFTRATIMGGTSGAVCMPSRNMILTGRTLFDINTDSRIIPTEHRTFPEVLRKNGYSTYHVGKWHQDTASHARCFSGGSKLFMSGIEPHPYECDFHWHLHLFDYSEEGRYVDGEYKCENGPVEPFTPPYTRYKANGRHSSTVFTDAAIDILNRQAADEQFCLYLAYVAPHDPRQYPKEYFEQYDASALPLPENFLPQHPFDNGDLYCRDELLAGHPRLPWEIREHLKDYYAIISHLDYEIGRLLDTLEEIGLIDDTIVILAGDNGLAVGQHGLMGKQNLYEHSIRVPLIISGPNIPRDQLADTQCYLADLCPTICELAGVPIPGTVNTQSLVPVIKNPAARIREQAYFGYLHLQRALREDRFKLIEYNVEGTRHTQLFDLANDPKETKDLSSDPAFAEELRRMQTEIVQASKTYHDTQPEYGVPFWKGYPGCETQ
jgi:arylsulfatase A-like enzyme